MSENRAEKLQEFITSLVAIKKFEYWLLKGRNILEDKVAQTIRWRKIHAEIDRDQLELELGDLSYQEEKEIKEALAKADRELALIAHTFPKSF